MQYCGTTIQQYKERTSVALHRDHREEWQHMFQWRRDDSHRHRILKDRGAEGAVVAYHQAAMSRVEFLRSKRCESQNGLDLGFRTYDNLDRWLVCDEKHIERSLFVEKQFDTIERL